MSIIAAVMFNLSPTEAERMKLKVTILHWDDNLQLVGVQTSKRLELK